MDLQSLSVTPALLQATPPKMATTAGATVPSASETAKRTQIKDTAQKFESSFLSVMMQQMFEGVQTSTPFGGGAGEDMFKSVLTEAMASQVTKSGGIGLASSVNREMLSLQGLK